MDEVPVRPGEGVLFGPIVFSPYVRVRSTFDDNVFKLANGYDPDGPGPIPKQRPESDFLYRADARLSFKIPFSHSYVALTWLPEYRAYARQSTVRKTSQGLNLDSLFNFSDGSRLVAKDTWSSGFFESRTYTPTYELSLSSTPYVRNDASIAYERFLTPLVGAGGTLTRSDFNAGAVVAPTLTQAVGGTDTEKGRLFDYFDYTVDSLELRSFVEQARSRIYASATLARANQDRRDVRQSQLEANGCLDPAAPPTGSQARICDQISDQIQFETIRQLQGAVGIQGEMFSATRGDMKLGYARWDFLKGDTKPYRGPIISGTIEHRFTERSTAFVVLERTPVQTAGQNRGSYLRTGVSLGFDQVLSRNFEGRLRVVYHRFDFPGSDQPVPANASESFRESFRAFAVDEFEPSLEVVYRSWRGSERGPLLLSVAYNPLVDRSRLPGLDINSQSITFTIHFGWF